MKRPINVVERRLGFLENEVAVFNAMPDGRTRSVKCTLGMTLMTDRGLQALVHEAKDGKGGAPQASHDANLKIGVGNVSKFQRSSL